ncbi:anti-sigma B factor, putative [Sagittula stellata E-37]|uniref:Anti-sigma B factor, putative n=2 Tax=Sagittula stellata TaxID=52603 RepID=A3K3U2_SAGS3|nr:anti-sigma B factor, putative [Sagittula stellata E-37]
MEAEMNAELRDGGTLVIQGVLGNTPQAVTLALHQVRAHLDRRPPFSDLDLSWEIVVAEVLNNIVEHAYADGCAGTISLHLTFRPDSLRAEFRDTGVAMPGHTPPKGMAANLDVPIADLPEGGFGWHLIRTLVTDLDYSCTEGTNRLALEMLLSHAS